ncbi:unnamed protein product [Amoebophrya sp. A120]|nr:unnamed protein product [Amoebophrya sp. A120]|eukprot:GSA120T00011891001.1
MRHFCLFVVFFLTTASSVPDANGAARRLHLHPGTVGTTTDSGFWRWFGSEQSIFDVSQAPEASRSVSRSDSKAAARARYCVWKTQEVEDTTDDGRILQCVRRWMAWDTSDEAVPHQTLHCGQNGEDDTSEEGLLEGNQHKAEINTSSILNNFPSSFDFRESGASQGADPARTETEQRRRDAFAVDHGDEQATAGRRRVLAFVGDSLLRQQTLVLACVLTKGGWDGA